MFSVNHRGSYTGFSEWLEATILSRSAILYNLHFLVGSKIVSLQNVAARITSINSCRWTIKIRLIIFLFRSYLHFNLVLNG